MSPKVWQTVGLQIQNPQLMDATSLINQCIDFGVDFKVVDYSNYWAEFDSQEDLRNQI